MAVVNILGAMVTKLDAVPPSPEDVALAYGRLRHIVDTVEVAAADSDGSVYRIARVHSSWCISSIKLLNDSITAGTSFDVGLYETAGAGGAVVDADAYASAVDLSSARTAPLDVAWEARDIANIRNKVWQDAGLTSDPGKYYDLCLTGNTVGSAAGTISAVVQFTAGD